MPRQTGDGRGRESDALAMQLARDHVAQLGVSLHEYAAAVTDWFNYFRPFAEAMYDKFTSSDQEIKVLAEEIAELRKRQEAQDRAPGIFAPLAPSTNGHAHAGKGGG